MKEVGFGLCADDVRELLDAGVAAIDVAGAGGTNWALVEGQRDPRAREIAEAFSDWGTPTAEAVQHAQAVAPEAEIIASGGLANGVHAAVALALGATAAGWPPTPACGAGRSRRSCGWRADRATAYRDLADGSPELCCPQSRPPGGRRMKVLVVGAGLGGLGTALRLQGAGMT